MLPISYNRLLTAGIYLTESSSSKCSEPQAAISMRPDGETAFSLQVGQLTLDAYIWRLGRVWILHHYHLKHSPVRILCLILTAIWSESCPVFCRYIATTQLRPVLTIFCSPQPYGSTRSLSRLGGDIMSPVGRMEKKVDGKWWRKEESDPKRWRCISQIKPLEYT